MLNFYPWAMLDEACAEELGKAGTDVRDIPGLEEAREQRRGNATKPEAHEIVYRRDRTGCGGTRIRGPSPKSLRSKPRS